MFFMFVFVFINIQLQIADDARSSAQDYVLHCEPVDDNAKRLLYSFLEYDKRHNGYNRPWNR